MNGPNYLFVFLKKKLSNMDVTWITGSVKTVSYRNKISNIIFGFSIKDFITL
jgi:hypothetical protein